MVTETASRTGVSTATPSLSSNPSAEASPSGNAAMARPQRRAAPARIAAKASVTVLAPNCAHRSFTRAAPMRVTAICAWMSPRMSAGCRLLARMSRPTSGSARPASQILIGGSSKPSWNSSVAFAEVEPATAPPTSALCAIDPANATMAPPANTGATNAMSDTCGRPPSYGWFDTNTSPSAIAFW